jgi:AcrR family transcriptional regulator
VTLEEVRPDVNRGRPPNDGAAPRGPEAVRRAVLTSAAELFSRRGVRAVSVREVANAAGVNPSLIHRYVGGKDALLTAVLADLVDQLSADLPAYGEWADRPPPDRLAELASAHQRIVAHLVIEGRDVRDYQFEFPVVDHIVAEIQRIHGVDEATARRRAGVVYAHDLSMRLFTPLLLQAAGLEPEDAEALREAVWLVNLRLTARG